MKKLLPIIIQLILMAYLVVMGFVYSYVLAGDKQYYTNHRVIITLIIAAGFGVLLALSEKNKLQWKHYLILAIISLLLFICFTLLMRYFADFSMLLGLACYDFVRAMVVGKK